VRVIKLGNRSRFLLETLAKLHILRGMRGQDLDCDDAVKPRVARFVTSPMPPAPMADLISYGPRRVPRSRGMARSRRIIKPAPARCRALREKDRRCTTAVRMLLRHASLSSQMRSIVTYSMGPDRDS
jgi:hypothetical protein